MDNKTFKIAEKIASFFLKEEGQPISEDLDRWRNEGRNELLFQKILREGKKRITTERYQDFPVEEGWHAFKGKSAVMHRRRILFRLGSFAAVVVVLVGVTLFTLETAVEPVSPDGPVQEARADLSQVRLILEDGEEILLEGRQGMIRDSLAMISNDSNRLTYGLASVKEQVKPVVHEIVVPVGGEYELKLSDGTTVLLNADSRLRYPNFFVGDVREVELQGEGFFKVTRNPQAPFVVKNHHGTVYVYGTEFNVSAYPGEETTEVTLVSGSLAVDRDGDRRLVRPGEQWRYDSRSDRSSVRKVDISCYTAWKDGKMKFKDCRLEDIMRAVSRWYGVEISYQTESLKDLRFGCNFNRHQVIEPLLRIFEANGKIKIEKEGNRLLIKEGR